MKTRCLSNPITAFVTAVFLVCGLAVPTAWAQLPGSSFEIHDGNVKYDSLYDFDWGNVSEDRQADLPSGSGDDSFAGGEKEDTVNPAPSTGSIPPNKSDLKHFGVYLEKYDGNRFLHMFWTRVQDPSGTTLMDFEFNQAASYYPSGFPVRQSGDMLIMYELAKGGKVPDIYVSFWLAAGDTGICEAAKSPPCWEQRQNISAVGEATGSINEVFLPAADNDGLGPLDPYTFGEASVDFGAIVGGDKCVSYGSAHLKSRSSDSFTATMKDFIAPLATSIGNCGTLTVIKVDDAVPPAKLGGATFTLSDGGGFSATCTTPSTGENLGKCVFSSLLAGAYQLCETVPPAGHSLPDPACQTVTITADQEVTVTVQDPRKPAKVNIHKEDDAGNPLSGVQFSLWVDNAPIGSYQPATDIPLASADPGPNPCTTNASGNCSIQGILPPGDYCVVEGTPPAGYDGAAPQCISLALDQVVSLTFVDPRHKGAILITKTRKHAAGGAGPQPHPGVEFTITGGNLPAAGVKVTTNAQGKACYDGLLLSSFVGNYSVAETLPAGYQNDGPLSKTVSVAAKASCGDGNEAPVSFSNTPLTNIEVKVHSQVVGGTLSTIQCTGMADPTAPSGDPSVTRNDLLPGTYSCTIVIDP